MDTLDVQLNTEYTNINFKKQVLLFRVKPVKSKTNWISKQVITVNRKNSNFLKMICVLLPLATQSSHHQGTQNFLYHNIHIFTSNNSIIRTSPYENLLASYSYPTSEFTSIIS